MLRQFDSASPPFLYRFARQAYVVHLDLSLSQHPLIPAGLYLQKEWFADSLGTTGTGPVINGSCHVCLLNLTGTVRPMFEVAMILRLEMDIVYKLKLNVNISSPRVGDIWIVAHLSRRWLPPVP